MVDFSYFDGRNRACRCPCVKFRLKIDRVQRKRPPTCASRSTATVLKEILSKGYSTLITLMLSMNQRW